jgi:ferritin-like metal-binding protein YciE
MSKTSTAQQLLTVALQDLLDAERAWCERGAKLAEDAGPKVAAFLDDEVRRSTAQAERIEHLLDALGEAHKGDSNIWLRAILDDAARDIRSTVAGPLRNTALIGAFRKGKQAERVSYETAMALAARLGRSEDSKMLTRSRNEEEAADAELARLLGETVDAAVAAEQ